MSVNYKNNVKAISNTQHRALSEALDRIADSVRSAAAANSRVKTGALKRSWSVKRNDTSTEMRAEIGSPLENAIWEEFGTGERSITGQGKSGFAGKSPSRALYRAMRDVRRSAIDSLRMSIGIR